jgi:serine/threonine protein kinase
LGSFAFEPLGRDTPENVSPYPLRAVVATGAHGRTYLAFTPTGRPAAVKVYRFGFGGEQQARARFLRAATVARGLHVDAAAPVLGAGFTMHRLWLATEYQPAPSLADAVFQFGPLPREGVRRLALGLTSLVGELHLVGLSGRGLVPSDVVLAKSGPRVVDLGFARVEGEGGHAEVREHAQAGGLVQDGEPVRDAIPGRYAYGGAVLAQDVRDLGAILYFAATGRMPDPGAADIVSQAVGDCPAALREPIAASLRENPARRPTLPELAAAASTAGVPESTALRWQGAPWLTERVLRDIADRAAEVATIQRRGMYAAMGELPESDRLTALGLMGHGPQPAPATPVDVEPAATAPPRRMFRRRAGR